MPLTDSAIRAAKPGEKDRKLTDEKGLHLLVTPTGSKLWRLKYRYGGKEKKLALGSYPEISLKEARSKAEDARRQLLNGIDPSAAKKLAAIARQISAETSFGAIALELIEKMEREGLGEYPTRTPFRIQCMSASRPQIGRSAG